MKIKILSIALIALLSAGLAAAQSTQKKNSPVGSWKYEAPMAPEGYKTGKFEVGYTDKKYSVVVILSENGYSIKGEQVKFEDDVLSCIMYTEGENVKVTMKLEQGNKMTGNVDYSQGQFPLTVTRIVTDK